ncbi:hypothetical protein PWT90_11165 [Aphanocladium album]|nr:hypothetical protein PWT90_11165 [Aphanocladium album]
MEIIDNKEIKPAYDQEAGVNSAAHCQVPLTPKIVNGEAALLGGATDTDGQMAHCCESALGEKNIYKRRGVGEHCHSGELPITFSGTVTDILEDVAKVVLRVVGRAYPLTALTGEILLKVLDELYLDTKKLYCCPEGEIKKWKNCAWYDKPGNYFDGHCPDMKTVQITDSYFGGGETCGIHLSRVCTFCCESDSEPLFLPVLLKNLFEHPPNGGVDTNFKLKTDKTSDNGDDNPNDAAFQLVVLVQGGHPLNSINFASRLSCVDGLLSIAAVELNHLKPELN